jgi:hypothetical protein
MLFSIRLYCILSFFYRKDVRGYSESFFWNVIYIPVDFEILRLRSWQENLKAILESMPERKSSLSDKLVFKESFSISAASFAPILTKKSLKASAFELSSDITKCLF